MPAPPKKNPAPPRTLWSKFPLKTEHRWLNLLLLFVPAAIILDLLHVSPLLIFIASALAIAPLASVLGESTGALASQLGPAAGGILSATMGNATEMIIALFLLNLLFVFRTHRASFAAQHPEEEGAPRTSRAQAIVSLGLATVLIAG